MDVSSRIGQLRIRTLRGKYQRTLELWQRATKPPLVESHSRLLSRGLVSSSSGETRAARIYGRLRYRGYAGSLCRALNNHSGTVRVLWIPCVLGVLRAGGPGEALQE